MSDKPLLLDRETRTQLVRDIVAQLKASKLQLGQDNCPLTAMQAAVICNDLNRLITEVSDFKHSQDTMHKEIQDLKLIHAKQDGITIGAQFWFKLGIIFAVIVFVATIVTIGSVLTGKISLSDLISSLL